MSEQVNGYNLKPSDFIKRGNKLYIKKNKINGSPGHTVMKYQVPI